MTRKLHAAVAVAVLLSGAGLTACGDDQPETPRQTTTGIEGVSPEAPAEQSPTAGAETPTVEVGETVEFFSQFAGEAGTTLKVKVNKIEYRTKSVEPGEGYTATSTPERGVFALVSLTVTNKGQSPGTFNGANFVWVSKDQERVEDVSIAGVAGVDDAEAVSTTFQPGQHATGTEVFDLPAKGGQLDYEIGSGAAPLLRIKLPAA